MFTCVWVCADVYVYTCVWVCICVWVHACVLVCTDACLCTYVYVCAYVQVCVTCMTKCRNTYVYMSVCHMSSFPFVALWWTLTYSFLLDWGARDPGPILVWISFCSGNMSRIVWSDGAFSLVQDSVLFWQQQRILNLEQKPNILQLELSSGRRRLFLDLCRAGGCRAEPRWWEVLWGHMTD